MGPHNSVKYEEVYAFGHQNATAMASMVQLQLQHLQHPTADGPVLTLTPFHFLPLINGTLSATLQRVCLSISFIYVCMCVLFESS